MNYQGQGKLIAYRTYTKDGKAKHVYNVLNGNTDPKTGLFGECEYITIIQDAQTLKELKPQEVAFEVMARTFSGQTRNVYSNIRALGGK
ncbi:hypothetical protein FACS1894211_14240 [Clostridia bacterium]|nr:hypothetical protein FACS1894211_14240 [Clostridia bacterium]